jgi:hypothetical protein
MLISVTEEKLEDVFLAYDLKLRRKIQAGLRDIKAGRTISLPAYLAKRARHSKKRP